MLLTAKSCSSDASSRSCILGASSTVSVVGAAPLQLHAAPTAFDADEVSRCIAAHLLLALHLFQFGGVLFVTPRGEQHLQGKL